jgi:putative membrane protein
VRRIAEKTIHGDPRKSDRPKRSYTSRPPLQEQSDMKFIRVLPVASVLAASALALTLRTATATSIRTTTSLDDPTIVAIFDEANTADIETGELASKMGSTKAIRDFGAMLARDHKNVRQQGRDLAKKLGVTPTPPKPDEGMAAHEAAMKKLRALKGAEFDKAFLQHEVGYHDAVIAAVTKTLLPAIQNAELKQLVTVVAPAFVAHRDAAKNMLEKQNAQ